MKRIIIRKSYGVSEEHIVRRRKKRVRFIKDRGRVERRKGLS